MRATKTVMWTLWLHCVNNNVWSTSDVILEYSSVKISQHTVPVGISDGALMFCDCMMLSFQIEISCMVQVTSSGGSSSSPSSSWGRGPSFSSFLWPRWWDHSRDVEVGIYWFLCSIILDVTAVSIEADVERILCFSHILLLASFAFDKECRRWKKGIVHAGSQLKKRNSTGSWFSQIMNNCAREGNYFAQKYQKKSSFEESCFEILLTNWQ